MMNNDNPSTSDEGELVAPFDLVETDEAGWFGYRRARALRPSERPKSVPPTGDDDIDRWLR
jgi:hypothetical protein